MKNAIVYSFHVRESSILDNRCYKQLRYSIDTLRKYNKSIPVYVYIAPTEYKIDLGDNVNIVIFDNEDEDGWPDEWTKLGFQQFLRHRWKNAIKAIHDYDLNNILYLDTDTVFYDDVDKLFNKYGNTNNIWAKPDNSFDLMNKIYCSPGMNDGQFIMSKHVAKQEILDHMKFYVAHTLKVNRPILNDNEYRDLCWVSTQYAVFDYFKDKENPVMHFDDNEVMLHLEPTYRDTSNLILQHYYSGNFQNVVPEEYW
jgi:hypothetical protein